MIFHKGKPIIELTEVDLASHLKAIGYQRVVSESDESEIDVKVDQFIRSYFAEKKKFYGASQLARVTTIKKNSKDYRHFKNALKIIEQHKVSYQTFLKAQVKGLSFVNGVGKFPSPNQIDTHNAEDRLLRYLNENGMLEGSSVPTSTEAIKVPIAQNETYKRCLQKIKNETATKEEAMFVAKCQKFHKGLIRPEISAYIRELE